MEAYVHGRAWYVIMTAVLPICYFISPYFLFIKESESEENIKLQQKKKKISLDFEDTKIQYRDICLNCINQVVKILIEFFKLCFNYATIPNLCMIYY